MDELVAFLTARWDERERWAQAEVEAAERSFPDAEFEVQYAWRRQVRHRGNGAIGISSADGAPTPREVLAEVKAKRKILELHAPIHGYGPSGPVCSTCGEQGNSGDEAAVVRWPCPTIRALAQPYAGEPGWREEWAL